MSKILVVDDVEENRYLLKALLKGHGHEATLAANGAEALEAARTDPPDLIISDILMPVMDGFILCQNWKSDPQLSAKPFIFFTATYTDPKDERFGLGLGADRYLIKPMEPAELIDVIDEVLEKNNGQAQPGPANETAWVRLDVREYNEVLIRKLEDKMFQLEEANRRLKQEAAEREQAEVQLKRLYTAIENAAETIIIANDKGIIEYVNPASETITGYSRVEVIGRESGEVICGPDNRSCYQEIMDTVFAGRIWEGHLTSPSKGGKSTEIEATISPISDSRGRISGFVSVMRDVTEQMRLERELGQSQKMEAIGTLAGGIAHDFNNILSAIIGYTDLAMFETPEECKVWRYLNSVLNASERARHLVEQILTFSRKTARERIVIDLLPQTKEFLKFLRASLPSTIDIRSKLEAVTSAVLADPIQIYQVILNICTNAAYAMRDSGGILEIAHRAMELSKETAKLYPDVSPGQYEVLSISDTGPGIDKATQARIFEPFFTTKAPGEGTGLGLSVAHGIIKSHKGMITVYSEVGQGSTFNIYLPSAGEAPEKPVETAAMPLPLGRERILFIDDEQDLVEIGQQIFERLGYQVTALRSSLEALEIFRKNPNGFDLVITDQTMPRLTGSELAGEILKIRADMPIIISTGYSVHISEEKARSMGVKGLIMKPIILRDVAVKIRSVLDGR